MKVGDLVNYKCTFSKYHRSIGIIIEKDGENVLVKWTRFLEDAAIWYPHWHLWKVEVINESG